MPLKFDQKIIHYVLLIENVVYDCFYIEDCVNVIAIYFQKQLIFA